VPVGGSLTWAWSADYDASVRNTPNRGQLVAQERPVVLESDDTRVERAEAENPEAVGEVAFALEGGGTGIPSFGPPTFRGNRWITDPALVLARLKTTMSSTETKVQASFSRCRRRHWRPS